MRQRKPGDAQLFVAGGARFDDPAGDIQMSFGIAPIDGEAVGPGPVNGNGAAGGGEDRGQGQRDGIRNPCSS
jgi:hypothetical protein